MYKNGNSRVKQSTREIVFQELKLLNKRAPKVLSLPNTNFIFEKLVKENYRKAFIECAEIEKSIYRQVLSEDKHKSVDSYQNRDVFEILLEKPGFYDLVWLDLCNNLSLEVFNKIICIVQNCLKAGSILAITLAGRRESRMQLYCNRYKTRPDEFRLKTFPKVLMGFSENLKLKDLISYKGETANSTPMNLYIFKN